MAPACGFALVGRYPSKAKFRAIVIIYNRGAPCPAITLTKSCGRCPRRCVSRCFGQSAGRRRLQTSRISGRENSSARELVPRHTITGNSPRYFGRSLSSLSAGAPSLWARRKGRFSFSVCYLPCNLPHIMHCTLCASEHVNLRITNKDFSLKDLLYCKVRKHIFFLTGLTIFYLISASENFVADTLL